MQIAKSKISPYLEKSNKKLKGPFKTPLFCLAVVLIVSLFGILVSGFGSSLKSLRDFSFLTAATVSKLPSQDLFVTPVKNFLRESPEITFIQQNSIVGVSSPVMITSRVLGTVMGETETETRKEIIEYVVEPGDTLSSIAAKFNISLNTILWANNFSSRSVLKVGQKIIILPVSGVLYSVKKNDTLSGIAKIYKGDVEEIIAFNELSNEGDIFIGDLLIIPDGKMPSKVSPVALAPVGDSYFIFPCEGEITQGLHYYNAIDVANKCGKPVVAAAGGIVQRAGWISNVGGRVITILHSNGVVTYYGHLSRISVVPGQKVSAGEPIGNIGNTGYTLGATGCHLHFDVIGAKNFLSKYRIGSYISWKK